MTSDGIAESMTGALRGSRQHAHLATADTFRHRLALRLHMTRQLGPLTLDQVSYLVERAGIRDCRAGETVLDSRDAARYHLLVLQGEVEVRRRRRGNSDAMSRYVALRPIDVMGGFALLNAVTRELRAQASTDCRCLLIDADLVDAFLGWNEQFSQLRHTKPALWRWASAMRDISLFSRIPPHRLEAVVRCMSIRVVEAGATVVRAGQAAEHYFTVETGEAEAWRYDPVTDSEALVARFAAGDAFGGEILMPDDRYATTVRMARTGRLRVLAKSDLEALVTGALQPELPATQARAMLETGAARLLDCRSGLAVLEPRIPGAIGMPLERLRWDMHDLDHDTHYIICCRAGHLARVAAFLLQQRHYRATVLTGGVNAWPYGLEWS